MPLITLKPLDDGQKSVEIPFGKTTIGRGDLLDCHDKKVSRNHAILEVTPAGEVYLTPTHVNPCFYQPTADSTGQMLKKDVPQKLENGDSFSLLPRAYRYQLSVVGETREEKSIAQSDGKPCKTNGSSREDLETGAKDITKEYIEEPKESEKSASKENNIPHDRGSTKENNLSKHIESDDKGTTSAQEDETFQPSELLRKDPTPSPKNEDSDVATSESVQKEENKDLPTIEAKEESEATETEHSKVNNAMPENCVDSAEKLESNKALEEEKSNSESVSKINMPGTESDNKSEKKISEENNDTRRTEHSENSEEENGIKSKMPDDDLPPSRVEAVTPAKRGRKKQTAPKPPKEKKAPKRKAVEAPKPKGRKKTMKFDFESGEEGPSQRQTPGRTSSRTNRQTRQGLSLEDFIVSDDDEWQSDRSEPKRRRRKRGKRKGDDSGSDWETEHKKTKKPVQKVGSGSESGSDWGQKKKKGGARGKRRKDKTASEGGSEEEPDQSTSNANKSDKPRVPCKFGKKCFRRNPIHTDQFSHPGDSDYASETESNLKNDATSEDDKDSPKKECPYGENCFRKNPQHKKDFKHTKKVRPQREAAKQADKKAKGSRNSDEVDSYDLNDSFLNDDSADEYKPVDSGSDYESGEKMKRLAKTKAGKNKRGRKV